MSIGKRRYMKKQSNAPQIRFQNFEAEWLDSTIGRHISLLNGRAYKQEELLDEGKYKVLRVGNFNTNSKWYYSNLELEENKYVNKGDLLYLWATNFGPEIWTEEKAIYHYHIWKLEFDRTEINQDYLNIWLESDKNKIQQNTNGSTMVHITKTMMEERGISLPNFDEQSAIGSLFRTLDELLTSYKDNLVNYQSLKAAMLSKMFPKAGQTVPEIRLDGFEGEWVEKRLKDISKRVTRKNSDLVSERALTISAQFGLIDQEEFFQKKIASKDVSGYYLIKKGEFAYNKSYSTGYPLGAIKRLDKYENGVLSTLYILFKAVDVDSDYLAHYYESDKWHREVSMCAAEGARNHGLLNIAPADFFNTRLVMPKELEEQQAIGSYFSNLDNLINSHQEKISQLETLKKKLLQEMFI